MIHSLLCRLYGSTSRLDSNPEEKVSFFYLQEYIQVEEAYTISPYDKSIEGGKNFAQPVSYLHPALTDVQVPVPLCEINEGKGLCLRTMYLQRSVLCADIEIWNERVLVACIKLSYSS